MVMPMLPVMPVVMRARRLTMVDIERVVERLPRRLADPHRPVQR